jgi:hypothetical protein
MEMPAAGAAGLDLFTLERGTFGEALTRGEA